MRILYTYRAMACADSCAKRTRRCSFAGSAGQRAAWHERERVAEGIAILVKRWKELWWRASRCGSGSRNLVGETVRLACRASRDDARAGRGVQEDCGAARLRRRNLRSANTILSASL